MEIFYPAYYHQFSCIAAQCPDSCCKEWDVDIDAETVDFYRSLSGPLGDRLRQVLHDTEDGTVMTIENGRCPMWRQDGLCRIQAELGHDSLCQVCRDFPRLRHDYGSFVEMGLELSCPEAARLILTAPDRSLTAQIVPGGEAPEYDTEAMAILQRTRNTFLNFLETTNLPFPQVLTVLLFYAHSVQAELDGGEPAVLSTDISIPALPTGTSLPLQDFFRDLEILTPQWKTRLAAPSVSPQWTKQHIALLHYFILRYWLQAVSDYDLVCRAKFAIAACLLIGCMGGDLTETAQLFSKEIENDPDNVDAILDGAYTAPALTDVNILKLLLEVDP